MKTWRDYSVSDFAVEVLRQSGAVRARTLRRRRSSSRSAPRQFACERSDDEPPRRSVRAPVKGHQYVTMASAIEQYQAKEKPAALLSIPSLLSRAPPQTTGGVVQRCAGCAYGSRRIPPHGGAGRFSNRPTYRHVQQIDAARRPTWTTSVTQHPLTFPWPNGNDG